MKVTLVCPCLFGLESVLAGEIRRMGGQQVTVQDGRVMFEGDETMIARANLGLRTAERVLIRLGEFPARTFDELFEGVKALDLEKFQKTIEDLQNTINAISMIANLAN